MAARRVYGDEGTSLIELIVGMLIMVFFMGMFTAAIVLMNRSATKAEAVSQTSTQLNQGFLALDKTVRYAAAISTPGTGTPSGDWYVELRTTNTGSEVCTQLRVDISTQQLQKRTWSVSDTTHLPSNLSGWSRLAVGIANGGVASGSADQPFTLVTPDDTVAFQQLAIKMVSVPGSAATSSTARSAFTLTALNSTSANVPATICAEEGRP